MNFRLYKGFFLGLVSLALGCMATGCDNIDSDDRYDAVIKPNLPPGSVPRTLLIQEFTGHDCRNCPAGAAALKSIAESYPGRVIIVGMHPEGGGPNTAPLAGQDFRCPEAQVMYLHYMPSGFPCAVFGGVEMSAQFSEWYTRAIPFMSLEAPITIEGVSAYDASTRNLTIDYAVDLLQNVDSELNVMAWVVENGIVGFQNDRGNYIIDYVHNHVLRASMNGDWGEPLGTDGNNPLKQYKKRDTYTGSASIELDQSWVAENCVVVLWVYKTSTKEVIQAIEIENK